MNLLNIVCAVQIIATLYGCRSSNNVINESSHQMIPVIYFKLGSDHYAHEYPGLVNVSNLPDSVYVFTQFKEIVSTQPLHSVSLIPFRDTTEDVSVIKRRVSKIRADFELIGIDGTKIFVLNNHDRLNPVAEEVIIALPSTQEQYLARSLNSCVGVLLQPR